MADKQIGELTAASALDGTELVHVVQGGNSRQVSSGNIAARFGQADQNLTAGYTATADNDGTQSSGTYTPAPAGGNFKRIVNGGAFTFAAPTASGDYSLVVQITNNSTAGAITFSGFSKTGGDAFTTTDGHDFFVFITKCNGFTLGTVQALQ